MFSLVFTTCFRLLLTIFAYNDDATCAILPSLALSPAPARARPCHQVLEQTPAAEISLVVRSLPLHHVDAVMALLR